MQAQGAKINCDVIVIGAGPAGLMAAYQAAVRGLRVLLIEQMDKPARKLRITGKGRCNVTNDTDLDGLLRHIRGGARFMYSSFAAFDSAAIQRFFTEQNVPLKVERGNRVFPVSDHADDIADALVAAVRKAGCDFIQARVASLLMECGRLAGVRLADGNPVRSRAVIVATGGVSYPKTGSTGDGYRWAREAGHTIIEPRPSLVPLVCAGDVCAQLQGLSLRNVQLTAWRRGKLFFQQQGELLFTHFGISGPLTLTLSADLASGDFTGLAVAIDLKPALDKAALDKRIVRDFTQNSNRAFKNSLDALLPRKLIPVIVEKSGIDPEQKVNSITAAQREKLGRMLKAFELEVIAARPIAEAVITAGGVALGEIEPRTMMSKKIENLYFAGEVLDVDGLTGGFNLSIAFATGAAAGTHCLEGMNG